MLLFESNQRRKFVMSVDAIQQVIEAEQKAEMLLQETKALIEEKEKRSQEAI